MESKKFLLWAICHCTSTLAGITHTHHDVLLEPTHLSHSFPLSRPADVCLHLSPSYLLDPQALPLKSLAIDISITPTPPCLNDFSKHAESALLTHLSIEARKFTGHDTRNSVTWQFVFRSTFKKYDYSRLQRFDA